ncbi:MAG: HEAT repeat domain-containing protein [Coriobacteriia bacterium]|nr:HEAT repeat domain-containing protein [Coriobacteriia bacterium]
MATDSNKTPNVPPAVERFVKQLLITMKAVRLYPLASSIPRENAAEAVSLLRHVLADRAEMRLAVLKSGLSYGGAIVYEGQPAFESFAREFYNRRLAEVRFHAGISEQDVLVFLEGLTVPPADLAAAGGLESRLWELGVDAVTVTAASSRIVETGLAEGDLAYADEEPWPPSASRIDEIIAEALGGRPRDQRLLVRVVGDSSTLAGYFKETLVGRGDDPARAHEELKVEEMARAVSRLPREQRPELYRNLADGILGLDPEIRRALLTERLLPEARGDEAIASVVRQMDVDDVCAILLEGFVDDEASAEGLARAIRNLAMISLAERDEVFDAAGAAMLSAGFSEQAVESVLEAVSPSRLHVRERDGAAEENQAVDSILKLVDAAPGGIARDFELDPGFIELQDESRRGITDGDVVGALITLVASGLQSDWFDSVMSLLEDSLELTIERGDYDIAGDAAQTFSDLLMSTEISPERAGRVAAAMGRLAGTKEITRVTTAMRLFESESAEYQACERVLSALGAAVVEPLLETLADEPDMSARKALVDLVAGMAGEHIERLGSHVSDSRWYFVRNVVAILGKTRAPSALAYLSRTLRHPDARVRRETVRALAGIRDRLADEMLVAALDDVDGANVQLAARYLGGGQRVGAAAALQLVAAGEGRGNRETGVRTEAMEALGRLGAAEALGLLESIAGKRRRIGGAKTRELRLAAEHAIEAITAHSADRQGGVS